MMDRDELHGVSSRDLSLRIMQCSSPVCGVAGVGTPVPSLIRESFAF